MLSLCSDCEACGHWADVSSLVTGRSNLLLTVFFSQIPGRKKTGGARGGVALWKESYLRAQRQDWTLNERSQPPLSAASVWDSPKHDMLSAWVSSACRGDLHVLKWRCGICNNAALKFAVFSEALRSRLGINRICKLAAARGPIWLLRHFNGRSRCQQRVSEEGSSSLKRRNLRCGGKVASYIARRPTYLAGYGGLHSHRLSHRRQAIGSFFSTGPMGVQLHWKKASVEEEKKFSFFSMVL